MKISVITVTYNSSRFISDAIKSVVSQSYKNIEYIVIDGASSDDTIAKVLRFENRFQGRIKVISDADRGIYDAMNKGLALASGDIVGFLNSDDQFASSSVIAKVAEKFTTNNCDIVFGDITYVSQNDTAKILRYWRSGEKPKNGMKYGWHPPHPAFYVRREKIITAGGFDTRYQIGADYEQMVRLIHRYQFKLTYIPEVFVKMREGGVSNRSIANIAKANRECVKAWHDNGFKPSFFLIPGKLASKIFQYVRAPSN